MASENDLVNGEYYSLSQFFSIPSRNIIIPDFQRDYCWGNDLRVDGNKVNIVANFLETLRDEHQNGETLLGKIDVYKDTSERIYLTDGQQRLTTLYLIIGMLYKKLAHINNDNIFIHQLKACLIFENDSHNEYTEPHLQYAIRESSVFFLRDLVKEFFLNQAQVSVKDIGNEQWFFDEYKLDPTIISMRNALKLIDEGLKEDNNFKLNDFSDFILNKVKLQYYLVEGRELGEERFVIINTTGKSLTESENVKPILLGKVENVDDRIYCKQWEKRETWFWKRKKMGEKIADEGVEEFLTWYFKIVKKQESIELVKESKYIYRNNTNDEIIKKLILLDNYFTALQNLIELLDSNDRIQEQFKSIKEGEDVRGIIGLRNLKTEINQNVLLPLLAFIEKFIVLAPDKKVKSDQDVVIPFLRRLRKNYFDLCWEERNPNYVDWRYVLQIIEKSSTIEECLCFDDSKFEKLHSIELPKKSWFNAEEKLKRQLKEIYAAEIEAMEDHQDFKGDLSFFLFLKNLTAIEPDGLIKSLRLYYLNYCNTIDLIRSEEKAKSNLILANYFRLFRIFIGCNEVGHIWKATWDFEGVLFSTLNRVHLQKDEFKKLCLCESPEKLIDFCKLYIKEEIDRLELFNINEEKFQVKNFIKCWLTLKVFYAEMKTVLISFDEGNKTGVTAWIKVNENKLIKDAPFSLENSICGFGVRSGFGYGNCIDYSKENLWCSPNVINTPFSGISYAEEKRISGELALNKNVINDILAFIKTK